MKLVKVNKSFFELCEKERVHEQLLHTKAGRPGVLILKLKYREKLRSFVVPLRSNIPGKAEDWEFKKLPPNKDTKPGFHHGVHYIKMFPVSMQYIEKYNIDNNDYLKMISTILDKSTKEIVDACQDYLTKYEKGDKHKFSPNIDGILQILDVQEKENK